MSVGVSHILKRGCVINQIVVRHVLEFITDFHGEPKSRERGARAFSQSSSLGHPQGGIAS